MKNENTYRDNSTQNTNRYIEFNLGPKGYAVPLLMVKEVISIPEITIIPNTPAYFLGIINLRGQVISLVDLRKKLKINEFKNKQQGTEEVIIILDIAEKNIGVLVDSINTVLTFNNEDIGELQAIESQIDTEYISGVYKKADSLTLLIDLEKILGCIQINEKSAA